MAIERDVDLIHEQTDLSTLLVKEQLSYTSHFCEENIYKLLAAIQQNPSFSNTQCSVVFLSNATKTIPVFCQRLAQSPYIPIIWDYHVILVCEVTLRPLSEKRKQVYVYDFDTTITPFPVPFKEYFRGTIQDLVFPDNDTMQGDEGVQQDTMSLRQRLRRLFRVVPADVLLSRFSSSRRHMKNSDGLWIASPPPWPLICASGAETEHTLDKFLDFSHETRTDDGYGKILDEVGFREAFTTVETVTHSASAAKTL